MKLDYYRDGDWWWKTDTNVNHKFNHKDYLEKIEKLYAFISELGTENDELKNQLAKITVKKENLQRTLEGYYGLHGVYEDEE